MRVICKGFVFLFLSAHATRCMQTMISPNSLFKAVKRQDAVQVRTILQSLTEVERKTVLEWQSKPEVRTALMQCTIDQNTHIASLLIQAGANMFATDYTGTSPISFITDMHHRNLQLLEVFIKTPTESLLKKIEWRLLNDLLNIDSPFTLEQNCQLIKSLLSVKNSLLAYAWLEGLAAKCSCMHRDAQFKQKYLPIYKAIAPHLLEHCKHYYTSQAEKIMQALHVGEHHQTFMKRLPAELKNLVIETYVESFIYSQRADYNRIMACPD